MTKMDLGEFRSYTSIGTGLGHGAGRGRGGVNVLDGQPQSAHQACFRG